MAAKKPADDWGPPLVDDLTDVPDPPEPSEADRTQRRLIRNAMESSDFLTAGQWVRVGEPPIEVFYNPGVTWVRWRNDLYLPSEFLARITDPRYPLTVLGLAVERGVVVFDRVTFVRGPFNSPLRVEKMRMNLATFKREASAVAAAQVVRIDGEERLVRDDEAIEAFLESYDSVRREGGRGVRLPDEFLAEVLRHFEWELNERELPPGERRAAVRQTAAHYNTSENTVKKWLKRARERRDISKGDTSG